MNILFLTNNPISYEIYDFLKENHNVILSSERIISKIPDNIELVISYNYKHIIKKDFLLPNKFINLHISMLPWNRGSNPNFWSIVNETPKGVTIHFIDEGIDTGDIIFQKEVYFDENLTLKESYELLNKEIKKLFMENFHKIHNNDIKRIKQNENQGSINYIKDFDKVKHILSDLGWDIKIKDLKSRYKKYKESISKYNDNK